MNSAVNVRYFLTFCSSCELIGPLMGVVRLPRQLLHPLSSNCDPSHLWQVNLQILQQLTRNYLIHTHSILDKLEPSSQRSVSGCWLGRSLIKLCLDLECFRKETPGALPRSRWTMPDPTNTAHSPQPQSEAIRAQGACRDQYFSHRAFLPARGWKL